MICLLGVSLFVPGHVWCIRHICGVYVLCFCVVCLLGLSVNLVYVYRVCVCISMVDVSVVHGVDVSMVYVWCGCIVYVWCGCEYGVCMVWM